MPYLPDQRGKVKRGPLLPTPDMFMSDDPLTRMLAISTMRDLVLSRDDPRQNYFGPLEHEAYTEQAGRDNLLNILPLLLGIPAYTGAKAAGAFPNARSKASWDEMGAGYRGLYNALLYHMGIDRAKRKPVDTKLLELR